MAKELKKPKRVVISVHSTSSSGGVLLGGSKVPVRYYSTLEISIADRDGHSSRLLARIAMNREEVHKLVTSSSADPAQGHLELYGGEWYELPRATYQDIDDLKKETRELIKGKIAVIREQIISTRQEIRDLGGKRLSKEKSTDLALQLNSIYNNLTVNMEFLLDQYQEVLDSMTTTAIEETKLKVTDFINNMGIKGTKRLLKATSKNLKK